MACHLRLSPCIFRVQLHSQGQHRLISPWCLWRFLFQLKRWMRYLIQWWFLRASRYMLYQPSQFWGWRVGGHILHRWERCEWHHHRNQQRYRWFFLRHIRIRRLRWQRRMRGRWRFRTRFRSSFLCWLLGSWGLQSKVRGALQGQLSIRWRRHDARFFPYRPNCWRYRFQWDTSSSRHLSWLKLHHQHRLLCCPYQPLCRGSWVYQQWQGNNILEHHLQRYLLCINLIRYQ